ncbi:MAG: sulfite exporter TauE/SafE family protein [Pseudomonadota bacterium]
MSNEILVGLILLLSAFTLSFSGFGFSLVAVPLLALVLPLKTAVVFQLPYALVLVAWQAWHYRGAVTWRELMPIMIGAVVALPVGAWTLTIAPEGVLKRALAAFIVLAVVGMALPAGRRLGRLYAGRTWWGVLWGVLSGWFQGAYSTGGPPAVIYIMAADPEPQKAMGFLGAFFTFLYVTMVLVFVVSGLLTWPVLKQSVYYAPVVAVGTAVGALLFKRASNRTYRQAVYGLLVLTAVLLWLGR